MLQRGKATTTVRERERETDGRPLLLAMSIMLAVSVDSRGWLFNPIRVKQCAAARIVCVLDSFFSSLLKLNADVEYL